MTPFYGQQKRGRREPVCPWGEILESKLSSHILFGYIPYGGVVLNIHMILSFTGVVLLWVGLSAALLQSMA